MMVPQRWSFPLFQNSVSLCNIKSTSDQQLHLLMNIVFVFILLVGFAHFPVSVTIWRVKRNYRSFGSPSSIEYGAEHKGHLCFHIYIYFVEQNEPTYPTPVQKGFSCCCCWSNFPEYIWIYVSFPLKICKMHIVGKWGTDANILQQPWTIWRQKNRKAVNHDLIFTKRTQNFKLYCVPNTKRNKNN